MCFPYHARHKAAEAHRDDPERLQAARGAGASGAPHAMAVNETVLAFVRGGTGPGAAGGISAR